MASDLINIGSSGTRAAQAALAVTGQNIANANNAAYTRRSLDVAEMNAAGGIGQLAGSRLSGVRIEGIARSASQFLAADARRTGSDLERADAQLAGLRVAERAIEGSGIYQSLVEFEASLAELASDPLSPPLRVQVLDSARSAASGFNLAAQGVEAAMAEAVFAAEDAVSQANGFAAELARTNTNLARAQEGSASRAAMLDQRDDLLAKMADIAGITASFDDFGRATVRLGDGAGPTWVEGDSVAALSLSRNPDGTIAFDLGGTAIAPGAGSLAGYSLSLDRMAALQAEIDSVATSLVGLANSAQTNGVDMSGVTGSPIFSGTTAANIAVALADPAGVATAPAGSPANSRAIGNLAALQSALANDGPVSDIDAALFGLSSEIRNHAITRDTLHTIAESAKASLASETAVDLDEEAANLVRFQQAFQASGKVIQTATDIFDTILGIG